jgi:hypothetical protein
MFYYLYEIRNNLNGKIYVGVHKTKNMNDGYMGSGKVIQSAIKKYGIENFTKTILEVFESSEEMFAREKEVVTEEYLARDDVYNLRRGGHGGWDYINREGLNYKGYNSVRDRNTAISPFKLGHEFGKLGGLSTKKQHPTHSSDIAKRGHLEGWFGFNINHTKETIEKMSGPREASKGEKNSQFGTMWITNEVESIKIKKIDSIPEGWRKGRIIK